MDRQWWRHLIKSSETWGKWAGKIRRVERKRWGKGCKYRTHIWNSPKNKYSKLKKCFSNHTLWNCHIKCSQKTQLTFFFSCFVFEIRSHCLALVSLEFQCRPGWPLTHQIREGLCLQSTGIKRYVLPHMVWISIFKIYFMSCKRFVCRSKWVMDSYFF